MPDSRRLLSRAEYHGLAGVLSDSLVAENAAVDPIVRLREAARDLDHEAHLRVLRAIDRAFAAIGLRAVALKGALLAERLYPRPAARVTGDTDILVNEREIELAQVALQGIGYRAAVGATERRFRAEHHHLHFAHADALPLELHFHAYRGFSGVLRSEPLLARSETYRDFSAIRVLAPEDEVVYLATHAAAHKFGRWSWLLDLRLLIDSLDDETLRASRRRAEELGFARPLALAARLLISVTGMAATRVAVLGTPGPLRGAIAEWLLPIPAHPIARAASRLAYTTLLCPSVKASARWATLELVRRSRELVRAEP